MPESRCQCVSQRMCSKARSPEISFESIRISSSDRKGVVCARQTFASGESRRVAARRTGSARVLFIEVSCGAWRNELRVERGEFIRTGAATEAVNHRDTEARLVELLPQAVPLVSLRLTLKLD